jgi:hypothetical protein
VDGEWTITVDDENGQPISRNLKEVLGHELAHAVTGSITTGAVHNDPDGPKVGSPFAVGELAFNALALAIQKNILAIQVLPGNEELTALARAREALRAPNKTVCIG